MKIIKELHFSHLLFISFVIAGFFYPDEISGALNKLTSIFSSSFDWFIVLSCSGFILLCAVLAFGKSGQIRLGAQDEKPEFSIPSWLAMLFAAGMGTGLVFYGAAEPLFHMLSPAPMANVDEFSRAQAAKQAMITTHLHWGFHAWSVYTICGLTIAYFAFRQQQPMLASSPMRSLWGGAAWSLPILKTINTFAVLSVVFGLVASIGQGVIQMSNGLERVGISFESEQLGYMLILFAVGFCYILSSLTGIGKGIKILSDINMSACIVLMVFVLLLGPTHFILETAATSLGDYITNFIGMGLNLRHYNNNQEWTQNWTINYFLWWIAWGPFVGVFIARISRGRTIKEFVLGVVFVPTLFSVLWFSTLGGAAIYMDMFEGTNLGEIATKDLSAVTFALLEQLPLDFITSILTLFLIFIFLVTSADSGSYVLGMFTSEGNPNPPTFQKLFWGIMVALVTAGVLLQWNDVLLVRSIAMAGAIPYLIIMILQSYALWKFLKKDVKDINEQFVNLSLLKNRTTKSD